MKLLVSGQAINAVQAQDANPPSCVIGVGPETVLTATTYRVALFDKKMKPLDAKMGRDFFAGSGGDHNDPRIIYDRKAQRFWISGMTGKDSQGNNICIARSKTPTPRTLGSADWDVWNVSFVHDMPVMALTEGGVYFVFSNPEKSILTFRDNTPVVSTFPFNVGGSYYPLNGGGLVRIAAKSIEYLDPYKPETTVIPFSTPLSPQRNVRQPGGYFTAGMSNRNACLSPNQKYLATCYNIGGKIHWWVVDAATKKLLREGVMPDQQNFDWYNPSIVVNDNGLVALSVSFSSSGCYVSSGLWCDGNQGVGTKIGEAFLRNVAPIIGSADRFGDWSGICLDPVDNSMWAIGVYAGKDGRCNWATLVQQFTEDAPPPPPPVPSIITGTIWVDGVENDFKGQMTKKGT